MKFFLALVITFHVSYFNCKAQSFNSGELARMVRMSTQQINEYVSARGFQYFTTQDMGAKYGTVSVFVNQNKKPSNVMHSPNIFLSYRPSISEFEKLKNEIQTKYKYYSTTTEAGRQMIYYSSDTRFHILLDDGFGRKSINVFTGLGGIR